MVPEVNLAQKATVIQEVRNRLEVQVHVNLHNKEEILKEAKEIQ